MGTDFDVERGAEFWGSQLIEDVTNETYPIGDKRAVSFSRSSEISSI